MASDAPAASIAKKSNRGKKKTERGYASYIHTVLKQMNTKDNKLTISASAMEVVNALLVDLETRLAHKAFDLVRFSKKSTLSANHVQTSAKLMFPREMSGMAVSEGSRALVKFAS